jgi:hypothetical protein
MNEIYMSSYLNIDSKKEREFAPYITTKTVEKFEMDNTGREKSIKEGYTAADFSTLVGTMSANNLYDMSSNLLYNPNNPDYIPTLREAAIEDKNQLIVQQNTLFALSAISAVSVAVVLFMIGNRE